MLNVCKIDSNIPKILFKLFNYLIQITSKFPNIFTTLWLRSSFQSSGSVVKKVGIIEIELYLRMRVCMFIHGFTPSNVTENIEDIRKNENYSVI